MARMTGRQGNLVTANGQTNPSIGLDRDGWVRLRILNASSSRFYRSNWKIIPSI
jgi:FtsP/CotA-like multicopper oxidase with cupredoxin domain